MGGSTYSHDDYAARASFRIATSTPVFKHTDDVRSGRASGVHPTLSPKGVKVRESRDSDEHPVTVPVGVIMDTTGSMAEVPIILEKRLSRLMGTFLDDKTSGKRYLGDAYPAILIGAIDDYRAMGGDGEGSLQVGQFESGIEIDQNLENLWLTGNGGGTYEESYELALYFFARHTVHDNWDKRGRKGYLFLIGDEHAYPQVDPRQVRDVIGDTLQAPIALKDIIAEVQERYHVFFIIPNMTSHYGDTKLRKDWSALLGQNVLLLEEPEKVCELVAATVALCEENVGLDDLAADAVVSGSMSKALVPIADAFKGASLARVSAAGLPAIAGTASAIERI